MPWIIIATLITIGLIIIVLEIIFVPGTTVVGILGLICVVVGIGYTFSVFGSSIGWIVTAITFVIATIIIVLSFKSGLWKRFALNQTMDSRVNDSEPIMLKVGDTGVTLSALRPYGNVEFGNNKIEVTTLGDLIESNKEVRVVKVEGRKIFVEQINI